jgi:hypothetical protein
MKLINFCMFRGKRQQKTTGNAKYSFQFRAFCISALIVCNKEDVWSGHLDRIAISRTEKLAYNM